MSAPVKIFWCEPTDRERLRLRRYRFSTKHKCAKTSTFCQAAVPFGEHDVVYSADHYITERDDLAPPRDDPRWPTRCEACGEPFNDDDPRQVLGRQVYVRPDTGALFVWEDALPGACRDAWWISDRRRDGPTGCGYCVGDDHRSLEVICPDGRAWMIDSRARNCTMKADNAHHCWVRHGRPEDGTLHVDKDGHTCEAGGGSIHTGTWHGFLRKGHLVVA